MNTNYMQWGACMKKSLSRIYRQNRESAEHRVEEHKNPKKDKNSACKKHTRDNTGHVWNYEEAENDQKLLIKELLHILSRRPTCNKQLSSQSSYEIKIVLIKAYAQYRSDV